MADVVPLKQPRAQPPDLRGVEFRLAEDCSVIELTLSDATSGRCVILEYTLTAKPDAFDLGQLRQRWDGWRAASDRDDAS